ncbi:MAG TPA: hypothetical protein VHS58_22870 [Acetobacteraceae bacterium]|jgi:hypothetical protein|nr:hypothetical protein [Acetobacteraceae bacterium]
MRALTLAAAAAALLASGSAFAQQRTAGAGGNCAHVHPVPCYTSDGKPIDHGPYTPEANRAYQGGGVILQGPPGAPAPNPGNPANLPPRSTP